MTVAEQSVDNKKVCASEKQALLDKIDQDRELILEFISTFVQKRSPNPPGDTTAAARHVTDFLTRHGHTYEVLAARPDMPNIVAAWEFGRPGKHLVLNGHMDVFPVTENSGWTSEPWGGERRDGKIYGRGVSDMKVGTAASVMAYHYLVKHAGKLSGKLSLVAVSDEETFGPWGARFLFERHFDKVAGDCCLIGEPTSPFTVRFGEKGVLWMSFTVRTKGAHGAYTHASESAIVTASRIIEKLLKISELPPPEADNLAAALDEAADALDTAYGEGASRNVRRITVNVGTITGGSKINMVPSQARFEVDFRVPNGFTADNIQREVDKILGEHANVEVERLIYNPPSWSAPDHELLRIVQDNAESLLGTRPVPVVGLAGTDARLWRYHDMPAVVFGPSPNGMASADEHVSEQQAIGIVKTHLLSAFDYLSAHS